MIYYYLINCLLTIFPLFAIFAVFISICDILSYLGDIAVFLDSSVILCSIYLDQPYLLIKHADPSLIKDFCPQSDCIVHRNGPKKDGNGPDFYDPAYYVNRFRLINAPKMIFHSSNKEQLGKLAGVVGVYAAFCQNTERLYIGSSIDLLERLSGYVGTSKYSVNRILEGSIKKYGTDSIIFLVLEYVTVPAQYNLYTLLNNVETTVLITANNGKTGAMDQELFMNFTTFAGGGAGTLAHPESKALHESKLLRGGTNPNASTLYLYRNGEGDPILCTTVNEAAKFITEDNPLNPCKSNTISVHLYEKKTKGRTGLFRGKWLILKEPLNS